MKRISSAIITALFLFTISGLAQETELRVVDEVVAQVNDGVITLSRVRREMKFRIDTLVEQGKTREVATAEVKDKEGEFIARIIEEELLMQKGKELGVESDVDSEVNRRFLEIMKAQNLKSLDALYKEMEKQGLDPADVRENWRRQFMMEFVVNREVYGKTLWGWTGKEVKTYFEKNKERFTKPEVLTLSEIFLSFAGRDEAAVRDRARLIVAELRKGGDFAKFAVENSDRPDVKETNGSVGSITGPELVRACEKCVEPLRKTSKGAVTDPIELLEGIEIFRVDDRKEASKESVFDEQEVRRAMTVEVFDTKRKEYMAELRQDSYIKINDTYRPIVTPFFLNESAKKDEKKPTK
jgi:parvulin-like peptidyl-prolyl isomerase